MTKKSVFKSAITSFLFSLIFLLLPAISFAGNFAGDPPANSGQYISQFCQSQAGGILICRQYTQLEPTAEYTEVTLTTGNEVAPLLGTYRQLYCTAQYNQFGSSSPGCNSAPDTDSDVVTFGGGLQDPALAGLLGGSDSAEDGNALTNLETIISRLIGALTVLASIFFIVYFVLGAFTWVTAGGDASKIQKSRDQMVQGVMGMIVIVISYAVVGMIGTVIGIDILNPAAELGRIFGV